MTGGSILLSDESILLAPSVLVQIYDNDVPGVIIRETNGITSTAEMRSADAPPDSSFYQDSYFMRLTKSITGTVNINVASMDVRADKMGVAAKQVLVNGIESHTITFTSSNWYEEVKTIVAAIDDSITEGVAFLNFASQPSNLAHSSTASQVMCGKVMIVKKRGLSAFQRAIGRLGDLNL